MEKASISKVNIKGDSNIKMDTNKANNVKIVINLTKNGKTFNFLGVLQNLINVVLINNELII